MPSLTNHTSSTDIGTLAKVLQTISGTLNSIKCQMEAGATRMRQILTHLSLITDHELDEFDVLEE